MKQTKHTLKDPLLQTSSEISGQEMTNADAVEAIFTTEREALYRYACYRLGERASAQDVLQELYIKLHRQRLSQIKNPRAYLYRALSNCCTQLLRKRREREVVDITSLKELQADDFSPSNFEQEQALIARLLATLPHEQSEVIRLHLHGECTFTEIAEILDAPLATIKSRYRYGIEHLRKELQKQNFL